MSGGRLGTMAHGLRHLRRAPDLAALRAARSQDELARLALVPAARNLGIAAGFCPRTYGPRLPPPCWPAGYSTPTKTSSTLRWRAAPS